LLLLVFLKLQLLSSTFYLLKFLGPYETTQLLSILVYVAIRAHGVNLIIVLLIPAAFLKYKKEKD
jgi:hypothetical protein